VIRKETHMKKKVAIVTAVVAVLLLAALAAGLNAIFSVVSVKVDFTLFSEVAREDAVKLQGELDKEFVGDSTVFLDLGEVKAIAEKYPAFKVESVEKDYPRTVLMSVTEREEMFAVEKEEGGFKIYDREGVYLCDRETNENRADKAENIRLSGFTGAEDRLTEAFRILKALDDSLKDLRMNLAAVTLHSPSTHAEDDYFVMSFREGVTCTFSGLSDRGEEKALAAVEKYLTLEDEDKMFGEIIVVEHSVSGEIIATYTPRTLPEV